MAIKPLRNGCGRESALPLSVKAVGCSVMMWPVIVDRLPVPPVVRHCGGWFPYRMWKCLMMEWRTPLEKIAHELRLTYRPRYRSAEGSSCLADTPAIRSWHLCPASAHPPFPDKAHTNSAPLFRHRQSRYQEAPRRTRLPGHPPISMGDEIRRSSTRPRPALIDCPDQVAAQVSQGFLP